MSQILNKSNILITGGTGSFGRRFSHRILRECSPNRVVIYSRDEYKQDEMSKDFLEYKSIIRFFIGDVRDRDRLCRACEGIDYVVHAAALKQVPALEYNPTEAIKTNILGSENVVHAATETGVKKVVGISTDKAVNPINLYGATKLVAERIFIASNLYFGGKVKSSCVRYGNVVASRGSVIPLFVNLRKNNIKEFPITDINMTRFWITLDEGVDLVLMALNESTGGEIFIPKIPSMKVVDLAESIDPKCIFKIIGLRPGEKIHETLISSDESQCARELKNMYVIIPSFDIGRKYDTCEKVPRGFSFTSNNNPNWLNKKDLSRMINEYYPV